MPKENTIKNRPIIIKAVKEVWEAIRSFENIVALAFIMNGKAITTLPIAFWIQRRSKLEKIFSFIFDKGKLEELNFSDAFAVGTDTYKVIAVMIAPAATLVVLQKGSIDFESWYFMAYNIKMTVSNIMAGLFLGKK